MTTLIIEVSTLDDVKVRLNAAFRGEPQGCRYSFRSEERLLSTLNPNRWAILCALTGAGSLGVREVARRVGRDIKGVHGDVQALLLCGLIDKTPDGKLDFPYDAVRVEMEFKAAA